jgi:hypothetical protein
MTISSQFDSSLLASFSVEFWLLLQRLSTKSLIPFRGLAVQALFPSLLIGTTANQQQWSETLLLIGQVSIWISILSATTIVVVTFRGQVWPLLITAGFLITKIGRVIVGENEVFLVLYIAATAALFCSAGAAVALQKTRVVYQQTLLFILFSIPIMILQLIGISEWVHYLRTDLHVVDTITLFPTLFVAKEGVTATVLQGRPAGLAYANNYLSIIIMFFIGLHFSNIETKRISKNDVIVCLIAVLAMAKIVFLTLLIVFVLLLITGNSLQRRRTGKVLILFFGLMGMYAFFFPGMFEVNTSLGMARTNFMIRASELLALLAGEAAPDVLFLERPNGEVYMQILPGHQSAYAEMARFLPYLGIAALFLLPVYLKGLRKTRDYSLELRNMTIFLLLVSSLIPLITSFLRGPVFWFFVGFGLLPFFFFLHPYSFVVQRRLG